MPETQNNNPPVLYSAPIILNATEHGALRYRATRDLSFARNVNCVPVALGELPKLLPFYPVVFTEDKDPMLVALTGVRNDENLFVDENGTWAENTYVPAYVRRYPFLLVRLPNNEVALGAEPDPAVLGDTGDAIFEGGQPTRAAQDVFRFCAEFQTALDETKAFCREVAEAGILKNQTCTVNLAGGKQLRLVGFSAVDAEMLDNLDNRTANGWRKKHTLKYLYLHQASLERMGDLAFRASKLAAQTPSAPDATAVSDAPASEEVPAT